jgi:hypothetical protein
MHVKPKYIKAVEDAIDFIHHNVDGADEQQNEDETLQILRELGEAWMWCSDCMSKLYSFDGTEDSARKCPHPSKCEDDRQRTKRHYH